MVDVVIYFFGCEMCSTWVELNPMLEARYCHTSTLLTNGCVFVVGGIETVKGKETTEKFDPFKNTWIACAKMKFGGYCFLLHVI
jgi:hypothetical protein